MRMLCHWLELTVDVGSGGIYLHPDFQSGVDFVQ